MQVVPDYFNYTWLKFKGMPAHDFKRQESKFMDENCCADKHKKHKPHDGKLSVFA